jgi:hypothetical protein
MKPIRDIARSIVALKRQLRGAVKQLDQEAAKLLARGKYEAAAALVESAKRSRQFVAEVEALRSRWKSLNTSGGNLQHSEKTPLWAYYGLVARGLSVLGGNATRSQIMDWITEHGVSELKPGDLARTTRGRVVWQRNVGRAKRAMLKEGYLEPGSKWKLTELGRNIAKGANSKPQ